MEDDLTSFDDTGDPFTVANVPGHDLHVVRTVVEPAPSAEGVVVNKRAHLGAFLQQEVDEMAPDEAVGPRDEHTTTAP
jgi:hypothetical protein